MRPINIALAASLSVGTAQAALSIVPGATWTATNTGEHVQAHGNGIIEENGVYYMIGEEKTDGSAFQAVNCYSSTNLIEWSFEGRLIERTEEAGDLGPNRIIERPKVIKNDSTGKYVLYLHIDSSDYKDARVGVGIGDSVCGTYEYLRSFRPLGFQSRDIGVYKDDDGKAYLLTEDREYGTRIIKLTDDYLDVEEVTFGWEYFAESPALVKRNGHYFIFGSQLTGWNPNDNVYSYAESLSGPWSNWTEFAPVGSNTHASQVSYVLPLGNDKAIYMGDRWHSTNLAASTYIWLPLNFDGTTVTLDWHDSWTVDVAAGTWSEAKPTLELEGEDAELANGARAVDCSQCSGSSAAGYLGGDEDGSAAFTFESGAADRVTLVVKHKNGDTASRHAAVSVNDEEQNVAFLATNHHPDRAGSSTVHVDLKAGTNTVKFSRSEGWGPDVDQLIVPQL
ncbi:glycosyl hydrolase family 43 protein [Colletotrichum karsti]|uniref:Glycosyl hydrolase family 43 protein n=1 Tax=Colletotrichum karsti TaxID=1095194 RepID=A0A9P6IDQ1_9PEZI|nr:glycosyl hydrolase family 43 protein [Colletotrichum karsti]KAF9876805.1 glycosyl hydrolase family 43 protein [Colletotrichum karsti]